MPTPPPILHTTRLILRRPCMEQLGPLNTAVAGSLPQLEPVFRWTQVQIRLGRSDDASAHLLDRELAWAEGTAFTWFVFLRELPAHLVGEVCLKTAHGDHGALELVFWIRSDMTGCGYGQEACDGVLEVAFGDLDADFIEARVAPGNPRSRRMLTRLGFTVQGSLWDFDRLVLFPIAWARSLYVRRLR